LKLGISHPFAAQVTTQDSLTTGVTTVAQAEKIEQLQAELAAARAK
jgi:hypothetical protein